jgi:hypothetical protein
VQFVSLFRDGQKASMSTRSGEYVTLRQLREEVGNDACRFFYMLRKCDQALDFDLDLAKSQSNENPVYYVQYAHARICSVLTQWDGEPATLSGTDLAPLQHEREFALCARLAEFPELIQNAARDYAPHAVAFYLKDLAGDFHSWYNAERVLVDDPALRQARLALALATRASAAERTFPAGRFATGEHVTMGRSGKYDNSGRKTPRAGQKKSGGGTLLGMFIGLVVGISIAFGVVWYLNKSPLPFQNKYEGAPKAENGKPAAGGNATTPQAPAALPGKPGDKPTDRRFEFYGLLEGKQPAAPGAAAPAPAAPAAPAVTVAPVADAKPAPVEIFFLQVGAFQKAADADNLKAKLALTGLETSVQDVSIPDKGTMHRVRVGPFRSPEEMNRARTLLSQNGVQGTVVKSKE